MAVDPFMRVGREDAEMRSMLYRIWSRSGGDAAMFDQLLPRAESNLEQSLPGFQLRDAVLKMERRGSRAATTPSSFRTPQFDATIRHIKDAVKGFTVEAVVTNIEGWEATLDKSDIPGVKLLVQDLEYLKRLIQDEKPKGEQIKKLLAKLGKETVTLASRSENRNAKALGEALAHVAGGHRTMDEVSGETEIPIAKGDDAAVSAESSIEHRSDER